MPFYMDCHIFDRVTVDEVKQAHIADKSVQGRHGVKYHQFWVNEEKGTVFCLMEGPTAEACAQVHREAHGNVACNISEVKKGFYEQFMGSTQTVEDGLVLKRNGRVDNAQRYLMVVHLVNRTDVSHPKDLDKLLRPERPAGIVTNAIREYGGMQIRNEWDDSSLSVFDEEENALRCALEIKRLLAMPGSMVSFKIGLSTGQPMSADHGFFEASLREAQRLNAVAEEGQVVIYFPCPGQAVYLPEMDADTDVRLLSASQGEFVQAFFELVESHLNDSRFSLKFITAELGISRPQLYRRITEITGRSPNHFIRDIRLRKALSLILENRYNVSEIAYEVGFGTPSYFTKRFQEKYGVAPSRVAG